MLDTRTKFDSYDALLRARQGRSLPLPNLIGIGAATPALHGMLSAAADVFMPAASECNFFGVAQAPFTKNGRGLLDYAEHFSGSQRFRYRADISPIYLHQPFSLPVIAKALPDAKIVVTLRRPLHRFLMQYEHHRAGHGYTDVNAYAADALARLGPGSAFTTDWYAPEKNLACSLYASAVKTCLSLFGELRCLVLLREDLAVSWREDLEAFLGVPLQEGRPLPSDPDFAPTLQLAPEIEQALEALFAQDLTEMPHAHKRRVEQSWFGESAREMHTTLRNAA